MKTVKLRDFQRYLHRIIREGEDLRIVRAEGEVIFTVSITKVDRHVSTSPANSEALEILEIATEPKCDKCNNEAEYYGTIYDEGERKVGICAMCYRIFRPQNFTKVFF